MDKILQEVMREKMRKARQKELANWDPNTPVPAVGTNGARSIRARQLLQNVLDLELNVFESIRMLNEIRAENDREDGVSSQFLDGVKRLSEENGGRASKRFVGSESGGAGGAGGVG